MAARGKKKGGFDRPPEGRIRRSQVITTYGPGSMVDLVDDAVLIWGLDRWRFGDRHEVIEEQRLRDRLAPRLKKFYDITLAQQGYFRGPPAGDEQSPFWGRALKATVFPRWMVCQNPGCRRLLRVDQLTRKQSLARYVHDCTKKGSVCVPVRFVGACPSGHLEDFPWLWFVHGGPRDESECSAPVLKLFDGRTGDFSDVSVSCVCGKRRKLVEALVNEAANPKCKGERPWLGRMGREGACEHRLKLLVRTASNGYFSVTESALSIPEEASTLHDAVKDQWDILQVATAQKLPGYRDIPKVGEAIAAFTDAQVLEAVAQIKAGQKPPREEIRRAEFTRLSTAKVLKAGDLPAPEKRTFYARRLTEEHLTSRLPKGVAGVTLAYKLREVQVQLGFTRFSSMSRNLKGETSGSDGGVEMAHLGTNAIDWLPAVEILGEGIFLQLDETAVREWEERPEVLAWERDLKTAFNAWVASRQVSGVDFPGVRFFLLHSLSHLLITQLSLECGYAASAIRERIYCEAADSDKPMAAILLKTGTPGTEGTLGGLVEQGHRLGHHLRGAVGLGKLCSNDPVCAQHNPRGDLAERYHDGAACYACLFIAESSCEWFNRHLDRSVVVPVVGQPAARAFFDAQAFVEGAALAVPLVVAPPASPPPVADAAEHEDPWDEVTSLCALEGAASLVASLRVAGLPVPEAGEEQDGVVTELMWRDARVAVVAPEVSLSDRKALKRLGWRVFEPPVEPIALVAAVKGSG